MLHITRFYSRIQRKLSRVFEQSIPYNQSLKPVGCYSTLTDYVGASGDGYQEIYSPEESELEIPAALLENAQNFAPTPRKGIQPAACVVAIKQGRLYTDATHYAAVISGDNKVIGDISLQVGTTKAEENGIFRQRYFSTPLGLKGNAFHTLIGGSGEDNYFHWMIDSLPRLHLLEKSGWLQKIDWFVVPKHSLPYQKDTLRLLGISNTKIVEGHSVGHVQADTLYATTFVRNIEHIPYWACKFLRDKFLPASQRIIQTPNRIYISRQDSTSRHVKNEAEVMGVLGKYGFKKVILSDFTFAEQVGLFEHAEAVVAPHGAGLTNIVFSRKGTKVIELFAREYTPVLYADLSEKVELDYSYVTSNAVTEGISLRQAMSKQIDVPIDKLEKLLQETLTIEPQAEEQISHEAV